MAEGWPRCLSLPSPRIAALLAAIHGVEAQIDPVLVRLKSSDFYWFSPVLRPLLDSKRGKVVIRPADEAEVLAVLAAWLHHRMPVVPRVGGTGNKGQALQLEGGVVLDMPRMDWIFGFDRGIA